ncbi:methyltransferase domain-containing protein [Treponema parvum]|uniref:Methyltransferase domain-containing protein n=2 Tax=Treponema parvum TaxID=138851 RepID=A0A975F604_9SPIR|nr:methyltransferase domain-containing protein [Treponema parvum]
MTVVIVQCRLSSSRLPGKALKELGNKTVLEWVLAAMKKVRADAYYVATDEDSASKLSDTVKRCGWEIFSGPLEDVLKRFCLLIKKVKADVVLRATADNPFLFYEAAQSLLQEYETCAASCPCDYITWTGLPHGSGVEVFNAHSLLKAEALTCEPYDREHVGPALYNHKDKFNCVFKPAPKCWTFPHLRTTIDTAADYVRSLLLVRKISGGGSPLEPYTAESIIEASNNPFVKNMILCVPCLKKGRGTGHLSRCLEIAVKTGACIYVAKDASLKEKEVLIENAISNGLSPYQIISELPGKGEFSLIITDSFLLEKELAQKLYPLAPVVSLDEGSSNTEYCDYLLDIIPGIKKTSSANRIEHGFINLPKNKRTGKRCADQSQIKTVLISMGGEDPADLFIPAVIAFAATGKKVTAIHANIFTQAERIPKELLPYITLSEPVRSLREKLYEYDLVVTHYGLTAYEAAAAGCAVLLLPTSSLHAALAKKHGFVCLKNHRVCRKTVLAALKDTSRLYPSLDVGHRAAPPEKFVDFISDLRVGKRLFCPVCASFESDRDVDPVVARASDKTFRRCKRCEIIYMSYTVASDKDYTKDYFFDQYKAQYGKTYLEDFTSIKMQGMRRIGVIDSVFRHGRHKGYRRDLCNESQNLRDGRPLLLDVGCAFGPFLSAAADKNWNVFGTDISLDAVNHVRQKLKFPVSCAPFPDFDPAAEFGVNSFNAVTMWYVIEHFKELKTVFKTVYSILEPGGIFAFSTPSASGVSRRFNSKSFFEQSPSDHYTLWELEKVKNIMKKEGFKVVKIVSTGHHPERFPILRNMENKKNCIFNSSMYKAMYKFLLFVSRLFSLGDTFEIYCKKIKSKTSPQSCGKTSSGVELLSPGTNKL